MRETLPDRPEILETNKRSVLVIADRQGQDHSGTSATACTSGLR